MTKLIVALDLSDKHKAVQLTKGLRGLADMVKVGSELFTAAGPTVVEEIQSTGMSVFLDLKFYDIPNTVSRAVDQANSLGVKMLTVHAAGGTEMLKAAKESASITKVLAVTLLTSDPKLAVNQNQIQYLIDDGYYAGVDGFICSAHNLGYIKSEYIKVTPGIKTYFGDDDRDHQSAVTPEFALRCGSDYIVVGRDIIPSFGRINEEDVYIRAKEIKERLESAKQKT